MPRARLYHIVILLTALLFAAAASAHQLPGQVLRVIDGDSLILQVGHAKYGIELADIDAPELNQPWGRHAADRLHRTLVGAFVVVVTERIDGYQVTGRISHKNRDVGLQLLLDGLAWQTRVTSSKTPEERPYAIAEQQARRDRRGLWSDPQPIAPWEWRQTRKMR